jgi:hypothetical protein
MSVVTTNYTASGNIKKITVVNEFGNGSTNIIAAVESALTGLGWTAFDTVAATLFNPIVTKVYSAANSDGVNTKYLIIRWDTLKRFFYTSTCEQWITNARVHYPINESYTAAGGFAQGYDIDSCFILVGASARHCMLWSWINGAPGLWTAITEFERVAPEDIAAVAVPATGTAFFNQATQANVTPTGTNALVLGTNRFTMETWVWPAGFTTSSNNAIAGSWTANGSNINSAWAWRILSVSPATPGTVTFGTSSSTVLTTTANTFLGLRRWSHVAVTYDGTSYRMFINGNIAASSTAAATNFTSGNVYIGGTGLASDFSYFGGYMSNFRLVTNQALYTANFTPATTNLTANSQSSTNTQLLALTAPANPLVDLSPNNFTMQQFGGVVGAIPQWTPFSANTTTTTPNWAWTSGVNMGSVWGDTGVLGTPSPQMFFFPRTFDSNVGLYATDKYGPVTTRGPFPPPRNFGTNVSPGYGIATITASTTNNYLHLADFANLVYGFDNNKQPTSTITVDFSGVNTQSASKINYSVPFGRMYNFGVTGGVGNPGDTTLANVDSVGGWPAASTAYNETSVSTECLYLPLNGGRESINVFRPGLTSNTYVQTGSFVPVKAITVGDTIFVAAANIGTNPAVNTGGIITYSLSSGLNQAPNFRANIPGGVHDILFDGNSFIYASTANGVVQMSAVTQTVTNYFQSNQTIANGCGYLGIDNKNIYASARLANTKPQVYTIDRATGNVFFGNTYNPPNGPTGPGITFTIASGWGTPVPDYTGNVYVAQTAGSASATTLYIASFTANTGANIANVNSTLGSLGGAVNTGSTLYYDYISNRLWQLAASPVSFLMNWAELQTANSAVQQQLTSIASGSFSTAGAAANHLYGSLYGTPGNMDFRGDNWIQPWRGNFIVGSKKPGYMNDSSPYSCPVNVIQFISYYNNQTTNFNVANIAMQITGITGSNFTGVPAYPWSGGWHTTNGCTSLTTWNNIFGTFGDNRVYIVSGLYGVNTVDSINSAIPRPTARLLLKG